MRVIVGCVGDGHVIRQSIYDPLDIWHTSERNARDQQFTLWGTFGVIEVLISDSGRGRGKAAQTHTARGIES